MENQSDNANSAGPSLSQVPPIRSFEFDSTAIGRIKTSFNYFRGTASVPFDFFTLPGLSNLNVKLSAIYNSNVQQAATRWNVDSPTGVLGLGWQMPFEQIVVTKGQSTSSINDNYYLLTSGTANPLVMSGLASDGAWLFQARNYEFWDIRYRPEAESWEVLKEDGTRYTYGGTEAGDGAILWAVGWNNWIGSSPRLAGQHRYAVGWNLVTVESGWGDTISYEYDAVNIPVSADEGMIFTQACYVKAIHDTYGRTVAFNYGEKYGARNPGERGIVEYQAKNAQSPEPNAYQDVYETRFLDNVAVLDEGGRTLSLFRFGYDFVNLAPTGDPQYPLFWKRCLTSIWQESERGEALPPMRFEYNAADEVNPAALKSITYPEGGACQFTYKKVLFDAPRAVSVNTPLAGAAPGVWHGDDYVLLTYLSETEGLRLLACSWDGRWVQKDVTAGGMLGAKIAADSLRVWTGQSYFVVIFRNTGQQRDEVYIYNRDKTRFGGWNLVGGQAILLPLSSATAPATQSAAGADFFIAYNRDYSGPAFAVFSYDWRMDAWTTPSLVPSSTDARQATGVSIASAGHYYAVVYYFGETQSGKFELFYRALGGAWQGPSAWTDAGLSVISDKGEILFRWSLADSFASATYVTGATNDNIQYSVRTFQWDENFNLLSDPLVVDLSTPVSGSKALYSVFDTATNGSLLSNNYVQLRNVGPVEFGGNTNWVRQDFTTSSGATSARFAAGDDIAVMSETAGGAVNNQAQVFNPNPAPDGYWSPLPLPSDAATTTAAGNCFTLGRYIYLRDVYGNWNMSPVQILGDAESVQNRAPQYIAYQGSDDANASTYVIKLSDGAAAEPFDLGGAQKMYVPPDAARPGTLLAGPRFLVTYPAGQQFDAATSLTLYSLDQNDLSLPTVDFPVAYLEIEDPYDPANSFRQSVFYGNSEQAQISYQPAAAQAQYPFVVVVPGVKDLGDTPPETQPQGRTEYYYSNGLSPQNNVYPDDWVYNYETILNGYLLAQKEFDAANVQVSSQLNYWQVFRVSPAADGLLYGGYARAVKSLSERDGVEQLTVNEYAQENGLIRSTQVSYYDSRGLQKRLATDTTYAWEVPAYSDAFLTRHLLAAVAQQTKSVYGDDNQRNYIASSVTTYKNWSPGILINARGDRAEPDGGPDEVQRWGDFQYYRWTQPGAQPPAFDFSNPSNRGDWALLSEVVERHLRGGAVAEQLDANGAPTSYSYDAQMRYLIGSFPNASLSGGEASYYGFEAYEDATGWQLGASASLIPNQEHPTADAHTGRRSALLGTTPSGQYGIRNSFTPRRQTQVYLLSAWVKKPDGFEPSKGQAAWLLSFSSGGFPVGEAQRVEFPDVNGRWVFMSHRLSLPEAVESGDPVTVEVQAVNENTDSYVLLDDLCFSPLQCPFQTRSYDTDIWQPDALLGPNGECQRMVYNGFEQMVAATGAADRLALLTQTYFSRLGNQNRFSTRSPNSTLKVEPMQGGRLTTFASGSEWEQLWEPGAPGTWVVDEQLRLTQTGEEGTLALADAAGTSDYCLGVRFSLLEAATRPLGIRVGESFTILWNPDTFSWELQDAALGAAVSQAVGTHFTLPAETFAGLLDRGRVSRALQSSFAASGYALPLEAAVTVIKSGSSWFIHSTGGHRYHLRREGGQINVNRPAGEWVLVVTGRLLAFYVAGRLVFSHLAASDIAGRPQLFFGTRVAVSSLANGSAPQVLITFRDSSGNPRQTQALAGERAVVTQTFTDSMGRAAVNTKAAYVIPTEAAPLLAYREDFAVLNWSTWLVSGLLAQAYPEDQGYPYSREAFEHSALSRVVERGLPGADFAVGAHSIKISYGANDARLGLPAGQYYLQVTTDQNGDETQTVSTTLEQVVYKVSQLKDSPDAPAEIKNYTLFDDAGCPAEVRSPNYYDPPEQSTSDDWVTARAFDYAGRVVSLRQMAGGRAAVTKVVYDNAGRVRFAQDPEGAAQGNYNYFKFDLLGRVAEEGYLEGQWNQSELERLAKTDPAWPATPATWRRKYFYDGEAEGAATNGVGRLTRVVTHAVRPEDSGGDEGVEETYGYNLDGNATRVGLSVAAYADGREYAVGYEYDNLGNITSIDYPEFGQQDGLKLYYRYNQLNQVTALSESPAFSSTLAQFTYLASGRPEQELLNGGAENALRRRFQFNSPLWLSSVTNDAAGEPVLSETLHYTEGGAGGAGYYNGTPAATEFTDPGANFTNRYAYNSLGAVEQAERESQLPAGAGNISAVRYDANGNFKLLTADEQERSYLYWPGTQQVHTVQGEAGGGQVYSEFQYDMNGSVKAASFSQTAWSQARNLTLRYDPGIKLTTRIETEQSGQTGLLVFQYGDRNRRVLKSWETGGGVTRRLYIHGTNSFPLAELTTDANGAQQCVRYIYGPGGMIAMDRGGQRYLVIRDHLGSVRAVLDGGGATVARYDYLTFGQLSASVEPSPGFMPYLYTGQEFDRETGLYNYRARFYEAELGRFLSADPDNQFFSPYIYASNNPVLYVDPTGRFSVKSFFSAIGGILIGAVEILVGVVIDVVAAVLEVVTGGLATPAAVALAALSGAFYGAGISAIGYSVFNFGDFDWRQYGIEMGIGALSGLITGGFGAMGAAAGPAITGVKAGVEASRAAQAANWGIRGAFTVTGASISTGVGATLSDLASGTTPGADVGYAFLFGTVTGFVNHSVPIPQYKSGWGQLAKRALVGVARAEVGVPVRIVRNVASGDKWDTGVLNAAVSGALWGSVGALQVKPAVKEALDFSFTLA